LEALRAAVVLDLAEDGLDDRLAARVSRLAWSLVRTRRMKS
jgi:hypothetical protein